MIDQFWVPKNNFLTTLLLIFISFTFVYRYWDVFFKRYGDRGTIYYKWSLLLLAIVHTLIGIFSIVEYVRLVQNYNLILGIASFFIFCLGQILRNRAIKDLKDLHSTHIEIKKNHELIESGIYERIRHPYYVGVILEIVSTPLVLNAYLSCLFATFIYLPTMIARIYLEEKTLNAYFGQRYLSYRERVPGFFPKRK